jgi:hypothetical protein
MARLPKTRVSKEIKRRNGRWTSNSLFALALALALHVIPSSLSAQAPNNETIYSRSREFRLPFTINPGEQQRIKQVQLYTSTDGGQTWQHAGTAAPAQSAFNFRADRDGDYWFAVATIDFQNQFNPPTQEGLRPHLKVIIDTQPPVVILRQGPVRDGSVSVDWDIREQNLDLSSLNLEYRLAGGANWNPLAVNAAASGEHIWNPGGNGAVEVRLRVRDLAKNEGEATLTLMPGQASGQQVGATNSITTQPAVSYVNSKQIKLNYKILEKGPSGVSAVELWMTRDGKAWNKFEDSNTDPPYPVTVQDEGVYGFTIIPRSGVGFKDREPRAGDPPQIWVEVDVTKPEIGWLNVDVGRGQDTGKVFITWKATDKNLGREPIKLWYAENAAGQWMPIAPTPIANTGRYEWTLPPNVPVKFFVRLEVSDKAGNITTKETEKAVIVDLKIPKGQILDVLPAGRQ